MRRPKRPDRVPAPPRYQLVFETFRQIGSMDEGQLVHSEPSCGNGDVKIRRYRITVEEVPDSAEVLAARLQKLWDESDNHHHADPLRCAARSIGYELVGLRGGKRAP